MTLLQRFLLLLLFTGCFTLYADVEQNIAPNPGFEVIDKDLLPEAYTSCEVSTNNPHSGKNCIRQIYKVGYFWHTVQSQPPFINSSPEKYYRLKVWNKNTVPTGDIAIGIRFINKNTNSITYCWKSVALNTQNNWTEYSFIVKTPKDTAFMAIYFKIGYEVTTGEVFWDDVSLTEIAQPKEYLTIKPLKSAVFFKNGDEFTSNSLFNKNIEGFKNVSPSNIKLDVSVNHYDFPLLEPIKKVSIVNGTSLEVNGKPFIPIENIITMVETVLQS